MVHAKKPPAAAKPLKLAARAAFAAAVLCSLACAIAGGLVRAGSGWPFAGEALGQAVAHHGFLMVCAFMGTVISLERAVAAKAAWAWLAPVASALSGPALLASWTAEAAALSMVASLAFVAVNLLVVHRQKAAHTVLLLVGALAWCAGDALALAGVSVDAVVPWWFAFLVLTIAAERLEMTRLMRRRAGAAPALHFILAVLVLSCGLVLAWPVFGGVLYGAGLCALAAWLFAFDIARRTVRADGLSRYMAVCLLAGYAWLAISGIAWMAMALGAGSRDMALHGLALGFVFSMMLGHAPVILPALARLKVLYSPAFYLPFLVLHASLALRLFGGAREPSLLACGARGNALAIALFAFTMAGSIFAWRLKHRDTGRRTS